MLGFYRGARSLGSQFATSFGTRKGTGEKLETQKSRRTAAEGAEKSFLSAKIAKKGCKVLEEKLFTARRLRLGQAPGPRTAAKIAKEREHRSRTTAAMGTKLLKSASDSA
jgi:hypothetical protein